MPPTQTCLAVVLIFLHTHTIADDLKSETSTRIMCEQIIKYDCGHMSRCTIRCIEHQPKQNYSATCFTSLPLAYEQDHHEATKFERRATLCPNCEDKGKDGEIYHNSVRRASAPTMETKKNPMAVQQKHQSMMNQVSASIGRSESDPERLSPQRLRRVRDAGNSSLRNEYNRLEPCLERDPEPCFEQRPEQRTEQPVEPPRNDSFEARRDRGYHPRDILTRSPELDSSASTHVPFHGRMPTSPTGFIGLINYAGSIHNPSSLSLSGLRHSASVLKMLQKGLERKSSDESFVCASAREVERGEGYE